MEIRRLETEAERLEAANVLAASFMHIMEAEKDGEYWAAFEHGAMNAALWAGRARRNLDGHSVSCAEMYMLGSLPEARERGAASEILKTALRAARERGDFFCTLIPFSFAFYRKFGFELAQINLVQTCDVGQFEGFSGGCAVRRLNSAKDIPAMKDVYAAFVQRYNLADLRGESDWAYREGGEYGERDWFHRDKQHYTYLFDDAGGKTRAFVTFVYVADASNPFIGTLEAVDFAFDGPEALHSMFAFFYRMRAKIARVKITMPPDLDLALLLPECDRVERRFEGHYAARVLNAEGVLRAMRYPQGRGAFSVRLNDEVLPENSGTYAVTWEKGCVVSVVRDDGNADLAADIGTFGQLAAGLSDLRAAALRKDVRVNGDCGELEKVFRRRPVFLR